VEPSIPIDLSGNDFMNFFYEKILTIRGKINNLLPLTSANLSSSGMALETAVYLDGFSPINRDQLSSMVSLLLDWITATPYYQAALISLLDPSS